jgi:hypothetical protein
MGVKTTLLHGAKQSLVHAFGIIDEMIQNDAETDTTSENLEDTLYEIENAIDGITYEIERIARDQSPGAV